MTDKIAELQLLTKIAEAAQELVDAMDKHEQNKFDITPSKNFLVADAKLQKLLLEWKKL